MTEQQTVQNKHREKGIRQRQYFTNRKLGGKVISIRRPIGVQLLRLLIQRHSVRSRSRLVVSSLIVLHVRVAC